MSFYYGNGKWTDIKTESKQYDIKQDFKKSGSERFQHASNPSCKRSWGREWSTSYSGISDSWELSRRDQEVYSEKLWILRKQERSGKNCTETHQRQCEGFLPETGWRTGILFKVTTSKLTVEWSTKVTESRKIIVHQGEKNLCQPSILYPAKLPFKTETKILCRWGGRLCVAIYSSVFGPLETNRMPWFCLTETWFQSYATVDVSTLESIFSANSGPISSVSYRNWVFPTCILSYTSMTWLCDSRLACISSFEVGSVARRMF